MNVDELLSNLLGFYQVLIYALLFSNILFVYLNSNLLIHYYLWLPPHHCKIPADWSILDAIPSYTQWNTSVNQVKFSQVLENEKSELNQYLDSCFMYKQNKAYELGIQPCIFGHTFIVHGSQWTVASELSLTCEKNYIRDCIELVHILGLMSGGLISGYAADRFGRKLVIIICIACIGFFGLCLQFIRDTTLFMVMTFLIAFQSQGLVVSSWVLLSETLPSKWRSRGLIGGSLAHPMSCLLALATTYYIQHWKAIQTAISLPILSSLLYCCIYPESLRWLITKGNILYAESEITKAARFNLLSIPANITAQLQNMSYSLKNPQENIEPLFKSIWERSRLRRNVIIVSFIGSTAVLVETLLKEHDSTLYFPSFGKYSTTIMIQAVSELAGILFVLLASNLFYRRSLTVLLEVFLAAITLSQVFTTNLRGATSMLWLIFQLLRIIACSGVRAITGVLIVEVTPSSYRATCVGLFFAFSQTGRILAPYLLLMSISTYKMVPLVVCSFLCLMSSLVVLLLPETSGLNLPDVPEEAERVGLKCYGEVLKSSKDPSYGRTCAPKSFLMHMNAGNRFNPRVPCPPKVHNLYRTWTSSRIANIGISPRYFKKTSTLKLTQGSTITSSSCSICSSSSFTRPKLSTCRYCDKITSFESLSSPHVCRIKDEVMKITNPTPLLNCTSNHVRENLQKIENEPSFVSTEDNRKVVELKVPDKITVFPKNRVIQNTHKDSNELMPNINVLNLEAKHIKIPKSPTESKRMVSKIQTPKNLPGLKENIAHQATTIRSSQNFNIVPLKRQIPSLKNKSTERPLVVEIGNKDSKRKHDKLQSSIQSRIPRLQIT